MFVGCTRKAAWRAHSVLLMLPASWVIIQIHTLPQPPQTKADHFPWSFNQKVHITTPIEDIIKHIT